MKYFKGILMFLFFIGGATDLFALDQRNIKISSIITVAGYVDQPYVIKTDDGNWLCVITTGPGEEGNWGQHIAATISSDKGQTLVRPYRHRTC